MQLCLLSLLSTKKYAEIKMGIILGFTGPIESLTPAFFLWQHLQKIMLLKKLLTQVHCLVEKSIKPLI